MQTCEFSQKESTHGDSPRQVDGIKPDTKLLVWEKWVTIRKEETTKLANKLRRPPVDLTMNLLEKIREDKERKVALENAQIEKKPSIRGSLWEQPQRLKQKCYCKPVYEMHRTPEDMGRPPVIEHIAVPQQILVTEKGLTGTPKRTLCHKLNADYEKYRDKREEELKDKLVKIDPFRPQVNDLLIIGSKPKPPPKKMPPLPSVTVTSYYDWPCEPLKNIYALRVNNTVIFKDIVELNLTPLRNMQRETWHEKCTSWTYYFNAPTKRAGRCKLYLENLGTVTLRYCWKKIKRPIPFIPEVYEQVFFFNKNEDVLAPGQRREIYFTFVTDKPGIHSEFWELSLTNVCLFDNLSDKFIVNLYGDSIENMDIIRKKVDKLKDKIKTKSMYNLVMSLLDQMIENAVTIEPHIYPYKKLFLEAELFVMKNPVCYYHQTEIQKMKEFYTEMVAEESWDLCISSWREVMLKKEFEERMKYYNLLKVSHAVLLKPWYEGDDILKQKYRAMKWLLGQLANKFDEEYERISDLFDISGTTARSDTCTRSRHGSLIRDTFETNLIRNIFFVHVSEHVSTFIDACAGVLSSIDLNRWLEFDFCRY